MSEKLYETYAKKVQLLLHNNDRKKELTDIVDNMMAVRKNPRYSDIGKEELLKNGADYLVDSPEDILDLYEEKCEE